MSGALRSFGFARERREIPIGTPKTRRHTDNPTYMTVKYLLAPKKPDTDDESLFFRLLES